MPTGKLTNPDGPGAQLGAGTIQCTNGDFYPFINNALSSLKKGDPVIFYTKFATLKIDTNQKVHVPIAVLHVDAAAGEVCIKTEKWSQFDVKMPDGTFKKFKTLWNDEWNFEDEAKIKELRLKDGFKNNDPSEPFKKGLIGKINNLSDIRGINP